jgi:hypothetical protein
VKLASSLIAVLALTFAPMAGARAARLTGGFSPGHWAGTMKIEGGIDDGHLHASGQGSGRFSFTVTPQGRVKSGHISVGETIVTTGPEGTFNSYAYGGMPLSGDSTLVTGIGSMTFHVETPYGASDGPVDAFVSLRPLTATCATVKGDAAIPAREFQSSLGIATNVTALFTAHRTSGAAADARNITRDLRSARTDVGLYLSRPDSPILAGLGADAVRDLSRAVAAASSCGPPPPGFAHGVNGQPQLGPKLKRMFSAAAANRAALGASKLEAVIVAAVESGASGTPLRGLIAAMEELMLQPPLSADAAQLRELQRTASLYHLDDLAKAAAAAQKKLGGP